MYILKTLIEIVLDFTDSLKVIDIDGQAACLNCRISLNKLKNQIKK